MAVKRCSAAQARAKLEAKKERTRAAVSLFDSPIRNWSDGAAMSRQKFLFFFRAVDNKSLVCARNTQRFSPVSAGQTFRLIPLIPLNAMTNEHSALLFGDAHSTVFHFVRTIFIALFARRLPIHLRSGPAFVSPIHPNKSGFATQNFPHRAANNLREKKSQVIAARLSGKIRATGRRDVHKYLL